MLNSEIYASITKKLRDLSFKTSVLQSSEETMRTTTFQYWKTHWVAAMMRDALLTP